MNDLKTIHIKEYGVEPEAVVCAPGVVNILGEHTDYNGGFVLQAALNRYLWLGFSKRSDNTLRFYSADFDERKRTTISNLKYKREDRWANYLKGVLAQFLQMGYDYKGMDISIYSEIPMGIGLGSSAALCVATAIGIKKLYAVNIPQIQIIQSAAMAESAFIGKDSEFTDALTCYLSRKGQLMYLDMRSLDYDFYPAVFPDAKFLLTNSNVPLHPVDQELKELRQDCKLCVEYLSKKKPGNSLRDYEESDLTSALGLIPENIRRLCIHVFKENQRVYESLKLIESGDAVSFGKLMNRSHESLRDNFEVSCPELDWLVKRAWEVEDILGSRMTGSGFGGCTISLVKDSDLEDYKEKLEEYERIFGFNGDIFYLEPVDGAARIEDNS